MFLMAVGMVAARASMVSVPLRGLVVFYISSMFSDSLIISVSVPLRGLVVFNIIIANKGIIIIVSVPLRGLVVFNSKTKENEKY